MDNLTIQGFVWMAGAATMLLYFKRRRKRKMEQ